MSAVTRRSAGLILALAVLGIVVVASIAVGAKSIPFDVVWRQLLHSDGSDDAVVVHSLRVPRTLLGLAVGAALGLAGALMQGLTRNPLADPGLLGVNAGASAAVVTAMGVLHAAPGTYVWFALLGAGIAAVVVYVLGSRGRTSATPVRLALAGAAVTAALMAYVTAVVLSDQAAFNDFRFWQVGALTGRPMSVLLETGPFLLAGLVVTLLLARPLNAVALGEDTGRALGARLGATRTWGILAVTLLCGAATAAAGPIVFVGLTVPHIARAVTGPDQRWIMPYAMVLAPILLLSADVLGRVIARPGEVEVGIVTAFVGAPVFILLARRRKLASL